MIYSSTIKRKKETPGSCYYKDEPQGIMLRERTQAQQTSDYMLPFIGNVQKEVNLQRKVD